MEHKRFQLLIKRLFDIVFSFLLLFISGIFILIAMLVIHIISPEAPVIFRQERVGKNMKRFTIYKLRTMTEERDENGERLPDKLRTKRWGEVIRTLNFDELPQLINIFKGDMSLIGPRPLLPSEMYVMTNTQQRIRQMAYPGISGWEAVNEAKTSTRKAMAEYDLFYVENWSLALDVKIFFMTAGIVLMRLRPDDSLRAPKLQEEEILEAKSDIVGLGKKL